MSPVQETKGRRGEMYFFTGVFRRTQEGQHLCRNQFKSVNTFEQSYDHIYYKTGPIVQEEEIFKFCENTFAIFYYLPM